MRHGGTLQRWRHSKSRLQLCALNSHRQWATALLRSLLHALGKQKRGGCGLRMSLAGKGSCEMLRLHMQRRCSGLQRMRIDASRLQAPALQRTLTNSKLTLPLLLLRRKRLGKPQLRGKPLQLPMLRQPSLRPCRRSMMLLKPLQSRLPTLLLRRSRI